MDFEDMDLDKYFGLEPEDTDEDQPEGEKEQEAADTAEEEELDGGKEQETAEPADEQGEMSPEERHANAARRRAAELDGARKAERVKMQSELDEFVKSLGLKNPYDGNKPIETKEQYDAYKKVQSSKALERGLSTGKLTADQFNEAVNAAIDERLSNTPAAQQQPTQEQRDAVDSQYAEIQALDPEAESLDVLAKDPSFLDEVRRTGSMVEAYKRTHVDKLLARQAQIGKMDAVNRSQSKSHLQRTSARGSGSMEITDAIRNAYRVFDPDITDDEIRKYESKDQKIRKT